MIHQWTFSNLYCYFSGYFRLLPCLLFYVVSIYVDTFVFHAAPLYFLPCIPLTSRRMDVFVCSAGVLTVSMLPCCGLQHPATPLTLHSTSHPPCKTRILISLNQKLPVIAVEQ